MTRAPPVFALKHWIGLLTMPLVIAVLLAIGAAICRSVGRPRPARVMLWCAIGIAYLASTPLVGHALLRPLEWAYPPLRQDQPLPAVAYVVVLGSGYDPGDGVPVTAALDEDGLARIVEGVRVARQLGGTARLIVSGGAPPATVPPAHGYAELAHDLGMSDSAIVVSDRPLDTAGEAQATVKLLGQQAFILVTSAYQMPRAMRLMRRAGANPIAAPTGQVVRPSKPLGWRYLLPGSGGLHDTERAIHEYLGLAALDLELE